jgi:hypothetical protein
MYVRVGSLEATPALGFKGAPIGVLNGIVGGQLHMTPQPLYAISVVPVR